MHPSEPDSTEALSPFVLLTDPKRYIACTWEMGRDHTAREYWVPFFIRHFETVLTLALEVEQSRGRDPGESLQRVEACRTEFRQRFTDYAQRYAEIGAERAARSQQGVTILTLDQWRDEILRRHGLVDPFELLKERENTRMLPLLPKVCAQLDALPPPERAQALVEGVFAGNIFDMGASATAKAFLGQSPDFFAIRSKLQPRPWLIDDFDPFSQRLIRQAAGTGYRRVVYFIDNAGSDFLLGALPLMRFFAQHGAEVVLAANERPTLNDMTVGEVRRWWPRILQAEPSLMGLPIHIVSTGTGEPLIDLLGVSAALNRACAGADLVILEGMGRGIESNLDASFVCDALNIAMIKDELIAKQHGGKVYDCVCRFRGGIARAS